MTYSPIKPDHVRPEKTEKHVVEADVLRYFVREARKLGWFTRRTKWIGIAGAPDVFCRHKLHSKNEIRLVEMKKPGGKLQPSQKVEFPKLRESGLTVDIVDSIDAANTWLQANTPRL